MRRTLILMAALTALLPAACARAEPDRARSEQLLATGAKAGGVSFILWSVGTGHWSDTPAECGRWHVTEHVLGRMIQARLGEANLRYGYAVEGFTAPDETVLLIGVGGGEEGLTTALQIIRSLDTETAKGPFLEQERALAFAEQSLRSNAGASIQPVLDGMPPADALHLTGNCPANIFASLKLHRPGPGKTWVISELDGTRATRAMREIRGAADVSPQRARLDGSVLSEGTPGPARAHFTPLPADAATSDLLLGSLAAWLLINGGSETPPPRFVPIGSMGFMTVLPEPIAPSSINASLAGVDPASAKSALRRAYGIFCSERAADEETVQTVARRISLDPWARSATFGATCGRAPEKMPTQAIAAVKSSIPLPAAGETSAPLQAIARVPSERFRVCGFSPPLLSRYRGYYSALLQQMLTDEVRFRSGAALRVDGSRLAPGSCLSFSVIGATASSAVIETRIKGMANDRALIEARIASAHRAQCVFLPVARRQAINDGECRDAPKTETIGELSRVLGHPQTGFGVKP